MIATYSDLLGARRYYLHAPGGNAIIKANGDWISQTTPGGWRTYEECYNDPRREAGKGGIGVAFAHSGVGADGGAIAFFDADYKPIAPDGDTPEKRDWFAAALADFRAMLSPPDAPIQVSRSGAGRHLIAAIAPDEMQAFAETLAKIGRGKAAVNCPLDRHVDAAGKESHGVKVEWWNWIRGNGRARFLTNRWEGERPSLDAALPVLPLDSFVANPRIAELIRRADALSAAIPKGYSRTPDAPPAGGGRRARTFQSIIQPYLAAGANAVIGALQAAGAAFDGGRFDAAAIGCHVPSGKNAPHVTIKDDARAGVLAHCFGGCDQERLWGAIHARLGWLPAGLKPCPKCGDPHDAQYAVCYLCKPKAGGRRVRAIGEFGTEQSEVDAILAAANAALADGLYGTPVAPPPLPEYSPPLPAGYSPSAPEYAPAAAWIGNDSPPPETSDIDYQGYQEEPEQAAAPALDFRNAAHWALQWGVTANAARETCERMAANGEMERRRNGFADEYAAIPSGA